MRMDYKEKLGDTVWFVENQLWFGINSKTDQNVMIADDFGASTT